MQQLPQDRQQEQIQRFYRQELQQFAQTKDALRAQHRPQENSSDSNEDSLSDRLDDDDGDIQVEAADMQTHIPASNVGYKLLLKMGWKVGTGLGQNATGRTAPIPIEHKQDVLGIGKQEVDNWYNESSTAKRKALEVERQAEETEEEKNKREKQVQQKVAVKAELEVVKSAFYCALCDKQYERISEYEVHLSSYDHNHKKRFKEMKETSRAGAAGTMNKIKEKEKRREERELAKMQEAAMKRAGAGAGGSIGTGILSTPSVPAQTTIGRTGFQPVRLGGFEPVTSSEPQPEQVSGSTARSENNQGTTNSIPTSGFQPVKVPGLQPDKKSGFQPVKVSGFLPEEENDDPNMPVSSSTTTNAGPEAVSAPSATPAGFQPVKLSGFKPMKIGGFQLKKPGAK